MPKYHGEQFDPEWEYFQADPEIEELVYSRPGRMFTRLPVDKDEKTGRMVLRGIRVGHDPNWDHTWQEPYPQVIAKSLPPVTCPTCRYTFNPTTPGRKFCSRRCSNQDYRVPPEKRPKKTLTPKACSRCGILFQPETSRRRYCSRRCAWTNNGKNRLMISLPKVCRFCEKPFTTWKEVKVFCSERCGRAHRVSRTLPRKCGICSMEFRSEAPTQLFCSSKCSHVHLSKLLKLKRANA